MAREAETSFAPDHDHLPTRRERKHRWLMSLERVFGWELSKRHYRLVKGA
jgi:hypothetical protein